MFISNTHSNFNLILMSWEGDINITFHPTWLWFLPNVCRLLSMYHLCLILSRPDNCLIFEEIYKSIEYLWWIISELCTAISREKNMDTIIKFVITHHTINRTINTTLLNFASSRDTPLTNTQYHVFYFRQSLEVPYEILLSGYSLVGDLTNVMNILHRHFSLSIPCFFPCSKSFYH